jgi:hypothetical protein
MRTTDVILVEAHDKAWKAMKDLPLSQEIEALFERLTDLQTWNPSCQTLAEHDARYEAGKPREIRARIQTLQSELYKTPENNLWFDLYQKLYA